MNTTRITDKNPKESSNGLKWLEPEFTNQKRPNIAVKLIVFRTWWNTYFCCSSNILQQVIIFIYGIFIARYIISNEYLVDANIISSQINSKTINIENKFFLIKLHMIIVGLIHR